MIGRNYRVDCTSNFNDETYAEEQVIGYLTQSQAERIAAILNENVTEASPTYYQARPMDSPLWRGMAEFV